MSGAEIKVTLLASHKVTAFSHKHDHDCSLTSTKETLRPKPQSFLVQTAERSGNKRTSSAATRKCWCHNIWLCLYCLIHPLVIPRNATKSGFIHHQFQLNRIGTVLSDEYDTQARENKTKGKVLTIEPLILASLTVLISWWSLGIEFLKYTQSAFHRF